ncbi:MFS general substrate transporter [Fragilariopsis cylindrus CCMP1102]|uniref:MFS general substrate transporter n=1 Tax=Fragilariopsis cylindrus CCMP1102 TaxID=635003 RepID=A0A1E7F3D5_9STRA|nr:MFS general substrate transporter [Fragilariopsis cylindrus CCMP1102]|eukprot:OEU12515.1 MFS general substrate transporter [Fragilariopsis cylindrus CCMP1102]
MVMIGLSVGVTTPAFPFVIQNLGLSVQEYGLVVSAFALTKLFGNIPFAVLVEQHGRKPYLVYSMIAIATGVGCIGLSTGFNDLFACRLITGLGVAGLSCAATMTVTDISTPLNRASSYAPITAGFAAGTAMGPALGGILIDYIGVNPTFYLVGGSFLLLGGINSILLDETMSKPWGSNGSKYKFPWHHQQQQLDSGSTTSSSSSINDEDDDNNSSIKQAFHDALGQWKPLLSIPTIRNVCIMNGFYWVALAGAQMTLLPLILTDPSGLAFTATQVGQVYMGMSLVQVLGNPIFARVVDKVGTVPGIVGGCSLISVSMYTLPLCDPNQIEQMAVVLGCWATGSSLLSSSPIAHISNHIDDSKRAQAIALLRTSGDVGFLIGASTMGLLSDWAGGLDVAMQSSSAILATATSWYLVRNVLTSRISN